MNADAKQMANWQETVLKDPWLFKGKLNLITDLLKDSFAKQQLILATRAHLDKTYMQTLSRVVQGSIKKIGLDHHLSMLKNNISTEMAKILPDHERVISLG